MAAEERTRNPLRFGIMCNGWEFYAWQAKAIRLLVDRGCLPSLVIMNDKPAISPGIWKKRMHYPTRDLFYRFFLRFFHHPAAKGLVHMQNELMQIPLMKCLTVKKNHSEYFSDADVDTIKTHQLDFILRFGFNIIRGGILDAARYGIWSYHHGDEQRFRGGPPGFWEICRDEPVTGAILQRLTDRLDAGIVLRKGYFKTIRHSWSGTIDQLFMETAHWPAQVASDIMNNVNLSWDGGASTTTAPIYKNPGNLRMIRFLIGLAVSRLLFHWNELTRAEKWNIGLARVPLGDFVNRQTHDLPAWLLTNLPHRYAADPFVFPANNELVIFYESYDYRSAKGRIDFMKVGILSGRTSQPGIALEKDHHLAYPYLVESDGKWYCVPESAQNRSVDLYLWDESAEELVFVQTLIRDIEAVDPTLFRYGGKWWLFCTLKALSCTHLHAFYSDDLTGPYQSHLNNPIKTDIRSARPAGRPFIMNDLLFRPAQDCSVAYGGRTSIQQIVQLDPYTFEERPFGTIEPFRGSEFPEGIHTLVEAGPFTVFDAKKYVFDRYHFSHQLKMRFSRRFSMNTDHT